MAKKQYLDLAGLTTYDEQIKSYIDAGDAATSTKLTNGSIVVKEAQHATSADSATNASNAANADKLGGQSPSYYAKASDIPTGALADKDIISESDLDSTLAEKVNAAAEGNHSHSNKTVLDGITSTKVSNWDSAEANAKAYADSAAATVKNDLLNGAGAAYDTLKELGDLIDDNKDAIDVLEDVAAGKADKEHSHEGFISYIDSQSLINEQKIVARENIDAKPKDVLANITGNIAVGFSCDKTFAELWTANDEGRDVIFNLSGYSNVKGTFDNVNTANGVERRINIIQITSGTEIKYIIKEDNSVTQTSTGYVLKSNIKQETGNATMVVMSQKAITNALALKADMEHDHAISDITNLQASLDAKAAQSDLDSVSSVANEAKSASASNTQAISANTSSITALTGRVATLEGLDTCEPIPTASITALFA